MRKRIFGGLASLTVAAALTGTAGPALAATGSELFVNNDTSACSDAGTGAQDAPYCTISAALAAAQPGDTVSVIPLGPYNEDVVIDKSNIVLRHLRFGDTTMLKGDRAGLTVDGQHDVTVSGFAVVGTIPETSLVTFRNSTRLTLDNLHATTLDTAAVGIQFTGVTDSTLTRASSAGTVAGLALDAATSGVVVTSSTFEGIDVAGSNDTIAKTSAQSSKGDGILIEPTAANTVVANSTVTYNQGAGIHNAGATGTAITNNTLKYNCGTGIRVDGVSSGVSVQNNIADTNGGLNGSVCPAPPPDGVEIAVYDTATNGTIVDYNAVTHGPGGDHAYAWNSPLPSLAQFQAASGQGAHDSVVEPDPANIDMSMYEDSANSAAPGFPSTDRGGQPREDNPGIPNTGAGPIPYADRGATEIIRAPAAKVAVSTDSIAMVATADASASTPGFPAIVSYAFDFGDGTTLTQATPVATHHYTAQGNFDIEVTVTDAAGVHSTAGHIAGMWHVVRTIALLSISNDRYVTADSAGAKPLIANRGAIGAWELFDVVEPETGYIALRSHANGQYISAGPAQPYQLNAIASSPSADAQRFRESTNPDGSVSLYGKYAKAYVTAESAGAQPLAANRAKVGAWEKFYEVDPARAGVSLRAMANNRYVTAESAGTHPLIANRTIVNGWETFDIVDLGGGYVALYSHADARFVTAESAGTKPLIANRSAIGAWEKFRLISNTDGTVSLQSNANGRYVTAESAGAQPLIANRTAIGAWEKFTLP